MIAPVSKKQPVCDRCNCSLGKVIYTQVAKIEDFESSIFTFCESCSLLVWNNTCDFVGKEDE